MRLSFARVDTISKETRTMDRNSAKYAIPVSHSGVDDESTIRPSLSTWRTRVLSLLTFTRVSIFCCFRLAEHSAAVFLVYAVKLSRLDSSTRKKN